MACVSFEHWQDATAIGEHVISACTVEAYVPGEFYRRELPCVLAVLEELSALPDAVIIDGYVWLDAGGTKGLGGHLFDSLAENVSVIGVAKNRFATATCALPPSRAALLPTGSWSA